MEIIGAHFKYSDDSGFWAIVERCVAEGMTRAQAVRHVVKTSPGAHKRFLESQAVN